MALFGVGLVVYEGLGSPEASAVGDLLVLGGAACWSLYAVLSVAAYSVLLGVLSTVVVAAPQLVGMDWSAVGSGA